MAAKKMPNQRDYITNKVLVVFTACLTGVLLLMFIYNMLNSPSGFMVGYNIVRALVIVGIIGIIGGAIKYSAEKKSQEDNPYLLVTGKGIIICSALVTLSSIFIMQYDFASAIRILYVIVPSIAVFYLIYYSYQREFFFISIDCAVAAALMWVIGKAQNNSDRAMFAYIALAVGIILAVCQFVVLSKIKKNNGKLGKNELLNSTTNYNMMNITLIAMLALLVAATVIGAQLTYYLMFAILAYIFVVAVYYTVKLM